MSVLKKLLFLCLLSFFSFGAARGAVSTNVRIISVGVNRSTEQRLSVLKYAVADAVRFAKAMEVVGLVPQQNLNVLESPKIDDLKRAFESQIAHANKTSANEKFIFYFSGHSDERGLHLKDGIFKKQDLQSYLGKVTSSTRIAIVDGCFASTLTSKGISKKEAFELPKFEYDEPAGSIFLSATSSRDFAYESDDLQGSLFTHYLLSGMYGQADGNTDGVVTVDELYQYVYRNTKLESMNYPNAIVQKPEFVSNLRGRGAIAIAFPNLNPGQLLLASDVDGIVTMMSQKGLQLFKVSKKNGEERTVQIPAGKYRVALESNDKTGWKNVEVSAKPIRVAMNDFSWTEMSLAVPTKKGVENSESSGTRFTFSGGTPFFANKKKSQTVDLKLSWELGSQSVFLRNSAVSVGVFYTSASVVGPGKRYHIVNDSVGELTFAGAIVGIDRYFSVTESGLAAFTFSGNLGYTSASSAWDSPYGYKSQRSNFPLTQFTAAFTLEPSKSWPRFGTYANLTTFLSNPKVANVPGLGFLVSY